MATKRVTKADLEAEVARLKTQLQFQDHLELVEAHQALEQRLCRDDNRDIIDEFINALDTEFWSLIERTCCGDVRNLLEKPWDDFIFNVYDTLNWQLNHKD